MNKSRNRGAGFFIIGMALFAIGLATGTPALGIPGLILVALAMLSSRKDRDQE